MTLGLVVVVVVEEGQLVDPYSSVEVVVEQTLYLVIHLVEVVAQSLVFQLMKLMNAFWTLMNVLERHQVGAAGLDHFLELALAHLEAFLLEWFQL